MNSTHRLHLLTPILDVLVIETAILVRIQSILPKRPAFAPHCAVLRASVHCEYVFASWGDAVARQNAWLAARARCRSSKIESKPSSRSFRAHNRSELAYRSRARAHAGDVLRPAPRDAVALSCAAAARPRNATRALEARSQACNAKHPAKIFLIELKNATRALEARSRACNSKYLAKIFSIELKNTTRNIPRRSSRSSSRM